MDCKEEKVRHWCGLTWLNTHTTFSEYLPRDSEVETDRLMIAQF